MPHQYILTGYTRRIERLFTMVRLIDQQPRQWTRKRLAVKLGVSERRVTDDLSVIRFVHNKHLDVDRGKGYYFTTNE